MDIHKFTACRYCADQIDVAYLARHEARCKTMTPEERATDKKNRLKAREAYRASVRIPLKKTVPAIKHRRVGRPHNSLFTNGHGRRLSATISIDFKSFREVLLQLAPMLSIDKVEVV